MPKQRTTRALISTQRLDQSVTRATTVVGQVKELFPLWKASTEGARELTDWYENKIGARDAPLLPNKTPRGITDLRELSPTPWAKMIADSVEQDFIVKDITSKDTGQSAPSRRLWQQNSLDGRQRAVHQGIVHHGKAYNLVAPAVGRLDGKPTAYIRGKSALNCDAYFRDDFDEWPEFFLEGHKQRNADGTEVIRWDFWDDVAHHWLSSDTDGQKMEYISFEPHNMGICPVVRGYGNINLQGRVTGEIEPYITLFKRINQSTMDRLVVQRFGAFIIRWIAGIDAPETDEEKRAAAIALSMTDLLMIPNENGKAGSLPATPLDGYIRAREADIRDLSAVSQTPSFHMLGLSDNVGAEGLAAAEASHMRKIAVWKQSLGEFWEASMRLAGVAAGDQDIANDFESRVQWKSTKTESFLAWAQGLRTLSEGLGIPGEALWSRSMEDWGESDSENARQLREVEEAKALADMAAQVEITAAAQPKGPAGGNAS